MRFFLFFILFLSVTASVFSISEEKKIEFLLNQMEKSNLIFIRNGTEYPAGKARAHLLQKYNQMKEKIKKAEEFIDKIASQSSLSGKSYFVKFPNGTMVQARIWFYKELNKIKTSK